MIKMLPPLAIAGIVSFCFIAPNAFADHVVFPLGQEKGSFQCTASPDTKISIHTNHVDVSGFCDGSEYVRKDGFIENIPAEKVNTHYFSVHKKNYELGSIDAYVNEGSGSITCSSGHDKGRLRYGDFRYCTVKK